ncbi:MAG: hypothetical protein C0504_18550 [Candidatus Solibacter sp.]|nr:hypothetical protein [Candidatus Solibacter sp.]
MHHRGVLPILLAFFANFALPVMAGNVFVLPPNQQSGAARVFSDALAPGGTLPVPASTHQVLVSPDGAKAIFLSSSASQPVTIVNIVNGQVSGVPRTIQLDGLGASHGQVSPDGRQLVVFGGANPGKLFLIDLLTEVIPGFGKIALLNFGSGTPVDMAITQDSRYAFVLSIGGERITVIELHTGAVARQEEMFGAMNAISVAPTGEIYATGLYNLYEFSPSPPFQRIARSRFFGSPGKLHFSPDGRYAFAANFISNSSILIFDRSIAGSSESSEPGSIGVLNSVPVLIDGNIAKPTSFHFQPNSQVMAYFGAEGRYYTINYPAVQVAETNFAWVGKLVGATGAKVSDEFPNARKLYYVTLGNQLTRLNLDTGFNPLTVEAPFGPVQFGKRAGSGAAVGIQAYNAGQLAGPSAPLKPYAVRVVDAEGRPVFNTLVRFQAATLGVGLSITEAYSNLDGLALTTAISPPSAGDFTVIATSGSTQISLTSKVEITGGGGGQQPQSARIKKVSGDGQLVPVGWGLAKPLVIRVLKSDGTPEVGKEVIWSAQSGVLLTSNNTMMTDENGQAQMGYVGILEPVFGTAYATYNITATVPGIGTANFVGTGYVPFFAGQPLAPAAVLEAPAYSNPTITAKLGTKLPGGVRISVFAIGGAGVVVNSPIPNVGLSVKTTNQNPATGPVAYCEGDTVLTKEDGKATCDLIVTGKAGVTTFIVEVGGGYGLFSGNDFILTVTPGDPATPVIALGNNQTGKPGAALPIPLTIEVSDGFGNALIGLPVNWEVIPPGAVTLTNSQTATTSTGRAATQVTLGPNPGTYDVKATVGGKSAIFKVTVDSLIGGFLKVSGDNQSGIVAGAAFPNALVVRVNDTLGQPLANVAVTFAVSSGVATMSGSTVLTAANGTASVVVTSGPTAGPLVITATIPNFPAIAFSLSTRMPGPSLTASSFRNYSTGEAAIAPGALVKISGQGIATAVSGEFWANMLRATLPTNMMGFTVEFVWTGGRALAPIMAIGNTSGTEWALVQAPFELAGSAASAIASYGGGSTTVANIPVRPLMPGILEEIFEGSSKSAIAVRPDGSVITSTNRARKGEEVRMYVIGMGQTSPPTSTNRVGDPDQKIALPILVGLETGKSAQVVEAKLAENLIGIYEIVFVVPQDAPSGSRVLVACAIEQTPGNWIWSNESNIAIQ